MNSDNGGWFWIVVAIGLATGEMTMHNIVLGGVVGIALVVVIAAVLGAYTLLKRIF